ncbi:MAG: DUF423 domain-containing protein [Gammaproteobacteria bacterium]|nr:DUF423 domain-containing protein [Gammaproteobacteria bacterium]
MAKLFLIAAAVSGLLVVALGAFGAHALKGGLSLASMEIYKTAVQYQMFHTTALLIIGLLAIKFRESKTLRWSGYLMIAGIVLFSGSLYALSISGIRWLGLITPIGGILMIISWLLLAFAAGKIVDSVKPFSN